MKLRCRNVVGEDVEDATWGVLSEIEKDLMLWTPQGVSVRHRIRSALRRLKLKRKHSGRGIELNKKVDTFLLFLPLGKTAQVGLGRAPTVAQKSQEFCPDVQLK
jgi:hypothetical protein